MSQWKDSGLSQAKFAAKQSHACKILDLMRLQYK